ncbi:MAG: helix-turn-helix domain-containing protein [Acidimicrobiales bacterium]
MVSDDSLGAALCRARSTAGLSQADVGAAAGVGQPMVSVYEHGRRQPTWTTFRRLLRAAGAVAEVRVEPLPEHGLSLAELAAHLAATDDDRRRRRLVLEFVGRFTDSPRERRRSLIVERPAPSGDRRWDALLGALAEHFAFHDAVDPPSWCTDPDRFLDVAWYWVDLPSVRRAAVTSAPTSFRRRNVWLDRVDLDRR